eukprot:gene18478-2929_t
MPCTPLAIALAWGAFAVAGGSALPSVVPQPSSIMTGGEDLALSPSFTFEAAKGDGAPSNVLEAAMERFGALLLSAPATPGAAAGAAQAELLQLARCTVDVPAAFGAMHGMETLVQLVDRVMHTVPSQVRVVDAPRFAFRATMVDCARRYIPVRVLEQHVDAMSATKMNVLHLHLVDSQSFPYESVAFPTLSKRGAYSAAEVYTQQDIAELARYAYARGVRVMPEIDTPGHVWSGGAIGTGPLDPSKASTFAFLRDLLAEVVPLFSGQGLAQPSFMMGGDEVPTDCWESNHDIVAFAKSKNLTVGTLARYFAQQLLTILQTQAESTGIGGSSTNKSRSKSKSKSTQLMMWQDVFETGAALPETALVNIWSGGWLWCSKQTSGSSVNRSVDCSADYDKGGQ